MRPAAADPAPMQQHHVRIARTARYWVAGEESDVRDLWIVCHGYAQLAERFLTGFRAVIEPGRRIAAPEALNRYYTDGTIGPHGPHAPVGATWMTREDRLVEIDDYVAWLDILHDTLRPAPAARVLVLGFSQGGATVSRWASRTTRRIDHLVLWGSPLAPDLTPRGDLFGRARLSIVFGDSDALATDDRVSAELRRYTEGGLAHELIRFAGGHRLDDAVLRRLADA